MLISNHSWSESRVGPEDANNTLLPCFAVGELFPVPVKNVFSVYPE